MVKAKRVADSVVHEHTYKVFPNDLNSYGIAALLRFCTSFPKLR